MHCARRRGRGGKPSKNGEEDFSGAGKTAGSATNNAFVKRDKPIEKLIESPIAELELKAKKAGAGLSLKAKQAKASP